MRIRLSLVRFRREATARPEPDPERVSELQPEPEPARETGPVLVAAPPPPPELEPEPEPEHAVVPLIPRDTTPRSWNIWELERLAETMNSDASGEERALLLVHLRGFADASGDLPVEFDALVREAFGTHLAALVT